MITYGGEHGAWANEKRKNYKCWWTYSVENKMLSRACKGARCNTPCENPATKMVRHALRMTDVRTQKKTHGIDY